MKFGIIINHGKLDDLREMLEISKYYGYSRKYTLSGGTKSQTQNQGKGRKQ